MATTTKKRATPKRDVYQDVTDRIVEAMEAGVVPWHQPWTNVGGPRNLNSGRGYRGINPFMLNLSAMVNGYTDPRWATFAGIKKLDGTVRKGEKGTRVVFWRRWEVEDNDNPGEKKSVMLLKDYTVFNVEQADWKTPLKELVALEDHAPVEEAEAVIAGYDGPTIKHGGDSAYFQPFTDTVGLPEMGAFESPETYYSAAFHELVHSTGIESRLNREDLVKGRFGDDSYGKEELVAEFGAAMLSGVTGIDGTTDANAAYIAHWLNAIQGDKKLVVGAAAQAQKAADLILGTTFEEPKEDS